jgi:hypothetical protein
MRIDPSSPEHPYRQLAAHLRERIERGVSDSSFPQRFLNIRGGAF